MRRGGRPRGPGPVPRRRKLGPGASIVTALTTAMFGLSLALPFPIPRPPAPPPPPEPEIVNWAPPLQSDVVSRKNALSHVLGYRGFDVAEISGITGLLRAFRDPRSLRPGIALRFSSVETGTPDRIVLPLN